MACGEGYGTAVLARRAARGHRRGRQPRGPRARPRSSTRDPASASSATWSRPTAGALRRGRLPPDDRARAGPEEVLEHFRSLLRPAAPPTSRRRTCSRWPRRARRSPAIRGTSRSTAPRSSARSARRSSSTSSCYGLFHARKLRAARAGARARLGPRAPAAGHHQAVLRLVHAGDRRPRLRAARRRRSTARSTSSRSSDDRERRRGALALVLHTHMPYVEGFGTWPFGEEWLWEAVASVYLPLLEVLDGAPVTRGLTPVLCDQLEAMRGEAGDRYLRFLREIRAPMHAEDAAGLDAHGRARAGRRGAPRGGRLRARAERVRAPRPRPAGRVPRPRRAWSCGPRPPPTRCCRCWPPTRACGSRWPRAWRRTSAASASWSGGFWLPECAYDAGARARPGRPRRARLLRRPDRRARPRRARAARARCSPPPARWPCRSTGRPCSWCGTSDAATPATRAYRDYHGRTVHDLKPWNIGGEPYDREAAAALAREHARDFVERVARRRLRRERGRPGCCAARSTPSCSATGGTRARMAARRCSSRRRAAGPRPGHACPRALERVRAGGARAGARRPGARGKDLSTWDSPARRRPGLRRPRGRAAHRGRRAAGHGPDATPWRARRASCSRSSRATGRSWSPATLAADYPLERVAGPRRRDHDAALAALTDSARRAGRRLCATSPRTSTWPRSPLRSMRALILSWEYPPLIEGGLARHVRKLAENLAAQGVEVHVLARGREESPAEEEMDGVIDPPRARARAPARAGRVRDLDRAHERRHARRGVEVGDRYDFDVVHGHDWLVAVGRRPPGQALPLRPSWSRSTPPSTAATRAGWTSTRSRYIHGVERWMANRAERRDHLLGLHARARGRHLRPRGGARQRDPERDRPVRAGAGRRPRRRCARASPSRTRSSCCWWAGSSTRRASSWRSRRCPG